MLLPLLLSCWRDPESQSVEGDTLVGRFLVGDVLPEDTPVLYEVYSLREPLAVRGYPSADSATVEKRYLHDRLEVVGEQGDWLAVKMRTRRSYPLGGELHGVQEQLERLYVQRGDVAREEAFMLKEEDLRGDVVAFCLEGEHLDAPREVKPDGLVRVEFVSEEEFRERSGMRQAPYSLRKSAGAVKEHGGVFVPMDSGRYLVLRDGSAYGGGNAADSVMTLERLEELESEGKLLFFDDAARRVMEECGAEGAREWGYAGDMTGAGLSLVEGKDGGLRNVAFLSRVDGRPVLESLVLGDLPFISPDSAFVLAVPPRWKELGGVNLELLRLGGRDSSRVAFSLQIPYMEFCRDGGAYEAFVQDGALHARVVSLKLDGRPLGAERRQFVRVEFARGE